MKRGIIIFILMLISINLVSAAYVCQYGGELVEDNQEIKVGYRKTVNGLSIGLISADEISAFARVMADVYIVAKDYEFNNETPYEIYNYSIGSYTVRLINISNDAAKIKVGGISKVIFKNEPEKIDDLQVYLRDVRNLGTEIEADVLTGAYRSSLTSDKNPIEIIDIGNTTYKIELSSASDSDANIKVSKCKSGNLIIIEDPIVNYTEESSINSEVNKSNNTPPDSPSDSTTGKPTEVDVEKTNETCGIAGFIKEDKYCNKNNKFISLKDWKSTCEKNYECKSQKCLGGICKRKNALARFWDWFLGLFE